MAIQFPCAPTVVLTQLISEIVKYVKIMIIFTIWFGVFPHYMWLWYAWRFLSFPFPDWVYQNGKDLFNLLYQTLHIAYSEHVLGIKYYLYGDAEKVTKKKERVICISNHQTAADWNVLSVLAERQGSVGHCRFVMKHIIQLVPLYGFCLYQHGGVFVKRHFFNSRKMVDTLKYLNNPKITTWMMIYPEGTRYSPDATERIERSQNFAKDRGLLPLNHVLAPKSKGFHIIWEHMKNNLDAVYDITIIYSSTKGNGKIPRTSAPSIVGYLSGECDAVYIHVNRIPIADVPCTESMQKTWLYNLYLQKDKILKDFYSSKSPQLSCGLPSPPDRVRHFIIAFLFMAISAPVILTSLGRSLWWKSWIVFSIFGYIWLFVKNVS